jgi:hypothetical protein
MNETGTTEAAAEELRRRKLELARQAFREFSAQCFWFAFVRRDYPPFRQRQRRLAESAARGLSWAWHIDDNPYDTHNCE